MPRASKLRGFLRKEILRSRIEAPKKARRGGTLLNQTPNQPSPALVDNLMITGGDANSYSELDSLFGEPLTEALTKNQALQVQLEKLLAEGPPEDIAADSGSPKPLSNPVLQELKEELRIIIEHEAESNYREAELIARQRDALIEEIRQLEEEDKIREASSLPEPVGVNEKKKLKSVAERAAKALAGLERAPLKRGRENLDSDLDGEERLRLGISLKKPATTITGHWKSTIHDYFPGNEYTAEGGDLFKGLSAVDKKRLRRELAEYGEKLAMAERNKGALKK